MLYEPNGDRYEGEFLDDLRHGRGRQTYGSTAADGSGGDVYEGEWRFGQVGLGGGGWRGGGDCSGRVLGG